MKLIINDECIVKVSHSRLDSESILKRSLFGYRHKRGKIEINQSQANTIKAIYKLALEGYSNKAIAEELNKRKVKTARKKVFTEGIVKDYLEEVRYIGVKDYPPIIAKEDYLAVNKDIKLNI